MKVLGRLKHKISYLKKNLFFFKGSRQPLLLSQNIMPVKTGPTRKEKLPMEL